MAAVVVRGLLHARGGTAAALLLLAVLSAGARA
jgi:hypothetical protein